MNRTIKRTISRIPKEPGNKQSIKDKTYMKLLECERLSFFWWTVGRNRLPIQSNPFINKLHILIRKGCIVRVTKYSCLRSVTKSVIPHFGNSYFLKTQPPTDSRSSRDSVGCNGSAIVLWLHWWLNFI